MSLAVRLRICIVLFLFALLCGACGRSAATPDASLSTDSSRAGVAGPAGTPSTQQLGQSLPALAALPAPQLARRASAVDYQLLPYAPALQSPSGTSWDPALLSLDGAAAASSKLAWAIFGINGFPTDGSVVPTGLTAFHTQPVWLAVADFAHGRWQLEQQGSSGLLTLDNGADLVSDSGFFYCAVLAYQGSADTSLLTLSTSLDLPNGPQAALTVPSPLNAWSAADFDAAGSDPGGSTITQCVYDFGDGSPTEQTSDPAAVVSHIYLAEGDYTVTLSIFTAASRTDVQSVPVTVGLDPDPPVAVLNTPAAPAFNKIDLSFSATGSGGGSGVISTLSYDWGDGGPGSEALTPDEIVTHQYASTGTYTVGLTVTNEDGRTASVSAPLDVVIDPERPVAVLNVLAQHPTIKYELSCDGSGSTGGSGTITTLDYNWGDASSDTTTALPGDQAYHTYTETGPHTITLTVSNDLGKSDSVTQDIDVADTERRLLLVFNSTIPESADLADYYASPETGRAIDPDYILGLDVGSDANADLTRAQYESMLRDPIKTHLDGSGYKDSLLYILLVKGVPHRITDANPASVDSELCLLYSDLGPANGGYPYDIWLYNGPGTQAHDASSFYRQADTPFQPNHFTVSYDPTYTDTSNGDSQDFTLNYLVGRLSAYTYAEAKLLVDRSLAADSSKSGWVVMDTSDVNWNGFQQNVYDTMVDPVFQYPDSTTGADTSLEETMAAAATYPYFVDNTQERIVSGSTSLPANFSNDVIAYTGWGVNHAGGSWAHGSDYILQDLGFNYLPGAAFSSYESYNGWNFNGDNLGNRQGQGQICDFLRMGGTVAVGNAWEPYTIGIGDQRWMLDRYLNHGDNWIESAYKGLWMLSWMEVVVGDPLCRVS